ncbi:Rha family transcriptional regulator [Mycobacterium intracellulare]|uniref:Rha family transcriptional regulator n=1 Tax=Mycobacterium intracellulare TaxID=1767 RepID=UPI0025959B90|nr:Rha family transcriptional regulator [Mycobacterium intracellulare]MDM3894799.1 Rha family transcriptional regulator [Mycobacterium intracellulare]
MSTELVFVGDDGQPFTTSVVIATETGNQHKNVLELVRTYQDDLQEIGRVAFETRPFETAGGVQRREVAVLDEQASALLMTYLKNTAVVRIFKKRLVAGFYAMRQQVMEHTVDVQPLTPLEYARRLVDAEERAEAAAEAQAKAEKQVEIEQRHRRAIEGGDGILLTDFGKKYFSEVRQTDFFEHLYRKNWLIDQRGTRVRRDGEVRNGRDHGKPTYKGRPYIYEHDQGLHGGKRRFHSRVRPQKEIELRDALSAEGLPVNTHSTGLVLISNDELKGLGA